MQDHIHDRLPDDLLREVLAGLVGQLKASQGGVESPPLGPLATNNYNLIIQAGRMEDHYDPIEDCQEHY